MSNAPQSDQGRFSRYVTALGYADFRTIWTASLSAGAAAWALIVARGLLVYQITDGSSLWVGVVTFAAMIPRVAVTPITGYLSDKFDRRRVLQAMFAANLTQSLVLTLLVYFDAIEIWHLVVLSFINGSIRATQMPAAQALIPNIVPRHLLLNAVSLNEATIQGSRLIGPLAIAPLLPFFGVEGAFALCTGFYAIGLTQSLRIKTTSKGQIDKTKSFFTNLVAGLDYVYKTPTMRAIVFLALFHCGLTMAYESLLPSISLQRFNAGESGANLMMMAVGGGALVSSVFLAGVRSSSNRGRLFLYFGLLSGGSQLILALSGNIVMATAGAALMGVSQAGFMTITHTIIQTIAPDWVRGRISGVYSIHIGGTMALINLVNGGFADHVDASMLLIIGGVSFIAVMVLSLNYLSMRNIYARGVPVAQPVAD